MAEAVLLFVSEGLVPCPNRGLTKLDTCLFCGHLEGVDLDSIAPSLTCTPPPVQKSQVVRRNVRKPPLRSKTPTQAKIDHPTRERLLDITLRYPEWGIGRITTWLRNQGVCISTRQISHFLHNEGLSRREKRLLRLEQRVVLGGLTPDQHQREVLEQMDSCFKEWTLSGNWPGQRLIQAVLPLYQGGRGTSVYAHIVIDTYSSYAFGLLHANPHPLAGIMLLQYSVLPFFRNQGLQVQGLQVQRITTPETPIFVSKGAPSYASFLRDFGLEQVVLHRESEYIKRFNRVFWKAWSTGVRTPSRLHLDLLQQRLDSGLQHYNHNVSLPGFPNLEYTASRRIHDYLSQRALEN